MADLTDDIAALRDIADDDDFVSPLARVLLHLLDRDTDPEPPEPEQVCEATSRLYDGKVRRCNLSRGHVESGESRWHEDEEVQWTDAPTDADLLTPPAPEPAVTADHHTTVNRKREGWTWRCSCGAQGVHALPLLSTGLYADLHVRTAERDEARARADAAEQENADLRARIRGLAGWAGASGYRFFEDRLRALLAGPPEGSEA